VRSAPTGDRTAGPAYDSLDARVIRGEAIMDIERILHELTHYKRLPVEAIRAADADRASVVPAFLQAVERYVAASPEERAEPSPIFFIFHMLGSWREKSAYRPLARLLRCSSGDDKHEFAECSTETSHRVMAAVFDGDPQPLFDVILSRDTDEFIRSRMCETLAIVTLRGELPREDAAQFLAACFADLEPEPLFVWNGWQSAIAMLGLVDLRPLVKQAFDRGSVDPSWLGIGHFEADLRKALEHPDASPWLRDKEYSLFGDAVEEFSTWYSFSREREEDFERVAAGAGRPRWDAIQTQAINPFRNVGRNDPCPCGSGKKFKKCCLESQREARFDDEAA
jgi:hypothetical protein